MTTNTANALHPKVYGVIAQALLANDCRGMRASYLGLLRQSRGALLCGDREPGLAETLRQLEADLTELGQRWYAGDTDVVDEFLQLYCIEKDARVALKDAPVVAQTQHPDDAAVDTFAAAMRAKLTQKRAEGYSGWQDQAMFSRGQLWQMLREHVEKGDPVDVANFAMFLHQRGERIANMEQTQ